MRVFKSMEIIFVDLAVTGTRLSIVEYSLGFIKVI